MIIWECLGGLGDDSIHYQEMERPSRSTTILFLCLSIFRGTVDQLRVVTKGGVSQPPTGEVPVNGGVRELIKGHILLVFSITGKLFNKAATTCDIGPVDVWYIWCKTGTWGTRLVHVVQGQLMSGTCGTRLVHVVQGRCMQ